MTALDLDHLATLLAAATPGPWEAHRYDADDGDINWQVQQERGGTVLCNICQSDTSRNRFDAALIVAAVNALPTLIAAARERDRMRRDLQRACRLLADACPLAWTCDPQMVDDAQRWEEEAMELLEEVKA